MTVHVARKDVDFYLTPCMDSTGLTRLLSAVAAPIAFPFCMTSFSGATPVQRSLKLQVYGWPLLAILHANTLHWDIHCAFGLVQTGGPFAPDVGEPTRRRHSLLLTKSPTLWDDRPPGRGYSRCLAKCIIQ
jgi:hypothetical protein